MKVEKYQNLYMKQLYVTNSNQFKSEFKHYNDQTGNYFENYREVQLHSCPFNSGLRILVTDGYKYLKDIHCKSIIEAAREFRKQFNLIKREA